MKIHTHSTMLVYAHTGCIVCRCAHILILSIRGKISFFRSAVFLFSSNFELLWKFKYFSIKYRKFIQNWVYMTIKTVADLRVYSVLCLVHWMHVLKISISNQLSQCNSILTLFCLTVFTKENCANHISDRHCVWICGTHSNGIVSVSDKR